MARTAFRQCVQPVADSRFGRITINFSLGHSRRGGLWTGETRRAHSVLLARVSRPLRWFTTGLPEITFLSRPEDARRVVGHVFLHHVPRGLGQFAGQRLGGDDGIGLLFLAVVEAAALVIEATSVVRGFHEGPGQILVAAFAVVLPFFFPLLVRRLFTQRL